MKTISIKIAFVFFVFMLVTVSSSLASATYTNEDSRVRIDVQTVKKSDSIYTYLGTYDYPDTGNTFIEIFVRVKAIGTSNIHVNPFYFYLMDSDTNVYSIDSSTFSESDFLGNDILYPDETTSGWVVFEIKRNYEPYTLGFIEEDDTSKLIMVYLVEQTQQPQQNTTTLYPAHINTPSKVSDRSATISWNQTSHPNFSKYEMYLSTNSSDIGNLTTTISDKTKTIVNLVGLQENTAYYVTVRTITSNNLSADSNVVSFTTAPKNFPPTKVDGILPLEKTSVSIIISWPKNTDADFARYDIYVSKTPDSIGNLKISIIHQNLTQYKIDDLDWETTYYITIRTIDLFGLTTDSSPIMVSTLAPSSTELAIGFTGLIFLIVLIDFIPGYWVYRNAQKRASKKPHLWFLIVLFTSIVGFIVYLMKRPRQQAQYPLQPPTQQ